MTVTGRSAADGWKVVIKDDGHGIPRELMNSLFQLGGRKGGRKASGGRSTGIGLVIVKKLVESHGGEVTVTSVPGKGSTFTFTIPLATSDRGSADENGGPPVPAGDLQGSVN